MKNLLRIRPVRPLLAALGMLALVAGIVSLTGSRPGGLSVQPAEDSVPSSAPSAGADGEPAGSMASGDVRAGTVPGAGAKGGRAGSSAEQQKAFQALPKTEQESLWTAFHAARRAVQPLTPHEAAMEHNAGVRFFAANPRQRITARFLDGAVRFESGRGGAWSATFRHGTGGAQPAASGERVEYAHPGGVTEWYVNRAEGIEHGFTVAERPAEAARSGELRVPVAIEGLSPRLAVEEGDGAAMVELAEAEGGPAVLRYGKLKVNDATGRELPSHFAIAGSSIAIVVADAGAAYPIDIDPLITSQEAKLGPEVTGDGAPNDYFGNSVALSGDTALVGAYGDDTAAGSDAGSAYVFVRSGAVWSQQAKLTAEDAAASDQLGWSVAVTGDTALVGARLDDTGAGNDAGSAYVFVRSGTVWSQQAKLTAGDAAADDFFGTSVALSGDTVLVGASGDDTAAGSNAGSAYVYVRSGAVWTQQVKLTAGDGAAGDGFGYAVALNGDTALLGADRDDTAAGSNAGGAYVFVRSGTVWSQQAKLTAGDAAAQDRFGISVALSGDTALVGAYGDDTAAGSDAGSAYVFVRSGTVWSQQAKLEAGDAAADDRFGGAVALSGDTALVGASSVDSATAISTGSAYVFVRSGTVWSQQAELTGGNGTDYVNFGSSLALSGETALVGALGDDTAGGGNAGSAHVFVRSGTVWSQQATLTAGDPASNDRFGTSVALSGNTALVGAYQDFTAAGIHAGSAYVFVRSGSVWTQQAKLTAGDAAAGDYFGYSVALSGETALVGAYGDDPAAGNDSGSAYVFVRSGTAWSQQAKLTAGDAANSDYFGSSVALSGDTALVGAWGDSTAAGSAAGSAYVFVRIGTVWSQQAKLTAADGAFEDSFGTSVALSGDTALVGAYLDDTAAGSNAGSAYVFVRSGTAWSQQAKLTAADGAAWAFFGQSVALSGDTALVGAYLGNTAAGSDAGSAYVFVRSGTVWSEQAKLEAGDAAAGDNFGKSVALSGDMALVGASGDETAAGLFAGSAYVFERSGTVWSQQAKLTAGDAAPSDQFGWSVALSGDTALVGAHGDDTPHPVTGELSNEQGSVYVFGPAVREIPDIAIEHPVLADLTDGVSSIHFGTVNAGLSGTSKTFTIRNPGTGTLELGAITVDGTDAARFVASAPGTTSIIPGGSTTFTVTFTPRTGGPKTAALHVASNVSGTKNPFDIALTGTGNFEPTLVLPASPVIAEATGSGGAVVSFIVAASDVEDGPLTPTVHPASGSTFPIGNTTVNVSAFDSTGLGAGATFVVRVQDTIAPIVTAPAVTVEANMPSGAWVSFDAAFDAAAATDVVGVTSITYSPARGAIYPIGTTTVTVTAKDAANNTGTGTFTVTVQDTTAPAISGVPANIVAEATGPAGAVVTFANPIANDAVDGARSVTCFPASGSTFPIGATTVTCTATDTRGNSSSANFTVTVRDTIAPVVTAPANMTVHATSPSGAVVSFTPTATDAVGVTSLTSSPASGSTFPPGTTTVTVTARDAANNARTATFTVTVTPLTAAETWRYEYFGSAENTGNGGFLADPDNDGVSNLLEWALGLNPTTTSPVSIPVNVNGPNMELTYTRSVAALNAGVSYTVQWSDTMLPGSWSTAGVSTSVLSDNGIVQQVKAVFPRGNPRYSRLLVSVP